MDSNNIHFKNRIEFRRWLAKNHSSCRELWMVFHKDKTTPDITYQEALEEAICYGWIDSIIKKVNESIYVRKFTPRNTKSIWSEKNKNIANLLIQTGKMTKWGLLLIEEAKKTGEWNKTREHPAMKISKTEMNNFIKLLDKFPESGKKFVKMSESMQREYAGYYYDAKKAETRVRRLNKIAANILKGNTLF